MMASSMKSMCNRDLAARFAPERILTRLKNKRRDERAPSPRRVIKQKVVARGLLSLRRTDFDNRRLHVFDDLAGLHEQVARPHD